MAAGLRIYNDDGIVQIDSDYRNFSFISKGSATCNLAAGGAASGQFAAITVTGAEAPMVAINPGDSIVCLWRVSVSGSTWTLCYYGAAGATFDYWVFDYYQTPVTSPAGLKVFNAAGDVVYHSDVAPMRIAGFNASGGVSGLPSGRSYAGIQTAAAFSESYLDLGFGSVTYTSRLSGLRQLSATSLGLFPVIFESYTVGSAGTDVADPSPGLIVVDVTNL